MRVIKIFAIAAVLLGNASGSLMAKDKPAAQAPSVAVGPQYGATHVYVAPGDVDRFVASSRCDVRRDQVPAGGP